MSGHDRLFILFRPPIHTGHLPKIQELSLLLRLGIILVLEPPDIHLIMSTLAASQMYFPPLLTVLLRLLLSNGVVSPKQICFVPSETNRWEEIKKKKQGLELLTTPPVGI